MKFINYSLKMALPMILLILATTANAQNARLNFDKLNGLEAKATDVIEVTIDGKMLELAKRVTGKINDPDAKKIAEAIKNLQGIYVRVYNFEKENEYNMSDIDEIRSQLNNGSWEKLANVRSKKNNQKIDVFTMFTGDKMSGLAVVLSETKSIALINVIGEIDIESLAELSGKWNIPNINIEKDKQEKPNQ
jgi:hypothetical protein